MTHLKEICIFMKRGVKLWGRCTQKSCPCFCSTLNSVLHKVPCTLHHKPFVQYVPLNCRVHWPVHVFLIGAPVCESDLFELSGQSASYIFIMSNTGQQCYTIQVQSGINRG
jgi:hypothetical protein